MDQPISKIKYTPILDKIKNINRLCLISINGEKLYNIIGIIHNEINKDIKGVKYDNVKFIDSNLRRFLLKSLIASLKGWRIPIIPTLLGPFRIWMYLKIFRSNKV